MAEITRGKIELPQGEEYQRGWADGRAAMRLEMFEQTVAITPVAQRKGIKISARTRELYDKRNRALDADPDARPLPPDKWATAMRRDEFFRQQESPSDETGKPDAEPVAVGEGSQTFEKDGQSIEIRTAGKQASGEPALDEIVMTGGFIHLEQMSYNHWWMEIDAAGKSYHLNFQIDQDGRLDVTLSDQETWEEWSGDNFVLTTLEFSAPEVAKHAIETFGSREAADEWLGAKCAGLGGRRPTELVGAGKSQELEELLTKIDYGNLA